MHHSYTDGSKQWPETGGKVVSLTNIAAAGFDIHLFEVERLVSSIDGSGDLRRSQTMEDFDALLIDKLMEADPMLIADLDLMGIETPILIEIDEDDTWTMVDGHHRLAWAAATGAEVPVIFVTEVTDPIALWEAISAYEIDYQHLTFTLN